MTDATAASAVISIDDEVREIARRVLRAPARPVAAPLEIAAPFDQLPGERLQRLRAARPALVLLDLDPDPRTGVRLARLLADEDPVRQVIALGPEPTSKQLIAAMRAGIAEYVAKPVGEDELGATVDRALRRLRSSAAKDEPRDGRLHVLVGARGGIGCTTLATNLAIELRRATGGRTLLVDLDLELGNAAALLGADPRYSLVDAVRNYHRLDTRLIASFVARHASGVHLLAAPADPTETADITGEHVAKVLEFLRSEYDHVIVDVSRSLSPRTLAAADRADTLYLVAGAELQSLRNLRRWLPRLGAANGTGARDDDRLRVVINHYDPEDVISLDDVRSVVGREVDWTLPPEAGVLRNAANTGEPAVSAENGEWATRVRALAAAVTGAQPPEERRRGVLSRLLDRIRPGRTRAGAR